MRNIKTKLLVLISLTLLNGCWGITLESDTPDEHTEMKAHIESFYGSPAKEVVRSFGKPKWIEQKGEATYYIYEWRTSDIDMGGGLVFIPFPVPVPFLWSRNSIDWYCLLMEFDKDNRLIHHASAYDSYVMDDLFHGVDDYYKQMNCLSIFRYSLATEARPGRIIEKAELPSKENGITYTYLIAISDNEEIRASSKYSGFKIGECVNVLIGKLGVRVTAGNVCPDNFP